MISAGLVLDSSLGVNRRRCEKRKKNVDSRSSSRTRPPESISVQLRAIDETTPTKTTRDSKSHLEEEIARLENEIARSCSTTPVMRRSQSMPNHLKKYNHYENDDDNDEINNDNDAVPDYKGADHYHRLHNDVDEHGDDDAFLAKLKRERHVRLQTLLRLGRRRGQKDDDGYDAYANNKTKVNHYLTNKKNLCNKKRPQHSWAGGDESLLDLTHTTHSSTELLSVSSLGDDSVQEHELDDDDVDVDPKNTAANQGNFNFLDADHLLLDQDNLLLSDLCQYKSNLDEQLRVLERRAAKMQQPGSPAVHPKNENRLVVDVSSFSNFPLHQINKDQTPIRMRMGQQGRGQVVVSTGRSIQTPFQSSPSSFLSLLVDQIGQCLEKLFPKNHKDAAIIEIESIQEMEKSSAKRLFNVILLIWGNHRLCLVFGMEQYWHEKGLVVCNLVNAFFLQPLQGGGGDSGAGTDYSTLLDLPPLDDLVSYHSTACKMIGNRMNDDDDDGLANLQTILKTTLTRLELWMDRQSQLDFLRYNHECQVHICRNNNDNLRFQKVYCRFSLDPLLEQHCHHDEASSVTVTATLHLTPNCPRIPGSVFLEALSCYCYGFHSPSGPSSSSSLQHFWSMQMSLAATCVQRRQTLYKSPVALITDIQEFLIQSFQHYTKNHPSSASQKD